MTCGRMASPVKLDSDGYTTTAPAPLRECGRERKERERERERESERERERDGDVHVCM